MPIKNSRYLRLVKQDLGNSLKAGELITKETKPKTNHTGKKILNLPEPLMGHRTCLL